MTELNKKTSVFVHNQQYVLSYKKHFLLCQSCSWKITYSDRSGKIGTIPEEKHARCPICTTGIIVAY